MIQVGCKTQGMANFAQVNQQGIISGGKEGNDLLNTFYPCLGDVDGWKKRDREGRKTIRQQMVAKRTRNKTRKLEVNAKAFLQFAAMKQS